MAVVGGGVVEVMPTMYVGRHPVAAGRQTLKTIMEGDADGYTRCGDGDRR